MKAKTDDTIGWRKNLNKILNKNSAPVKNQITFQSVTTGKNLELKQCLLEDLLPQSLVSSPISTLTSSDNAWIASSMLSRISDTSNNLVVLEDEFPIGIIGTCEIINGLFKNPTSEFFHDVLAKDIMNRKFYLDTREVKLLKLFEQMKKTNRAFVIIQNGKQNYSALSIREILEIGSLCKTDITAPNLPERKIKIFKRDDSIRYLLKSLLQNQNEFLMLENEGLVIDRMSIIDKITTDLEFLQKVDNFLDLNASIFRFQSPKLIPDKLTLSEICKVMFNMKQPYVMTPNRIYSPYDVLMGLSNGLFD